MLGVPWITTSTAAPGRSRRCGATPRYPSTTLSGTLANADRVEPVGYREQHRRGMRNPDDVREHPAELDAGERLHAEVGEHGVLVTDRSVARAARTTHAAADLERRQDDLAGPQVRRPRPRRRSTSAAASCPSAKDSSPGRGPTRMRNGSISQRATAIGRMSASRGSSDRGFVDVEPLDRARSDTAQLPHGIPVTAAR